MFFRNVEELFAQLYSVVPQLATIFSSYYVFYNNDWPASAGLLVTAFVVTHIKEMILCIEKKIPKQWAGI